MKVTKLVADSVRYLSSGTDSKRTGKKPVEPARNRVRSGNDMIRDYEVARGYLKRVRTPAPAFITLCPRKVGGRLDLFGSVPQASQNIRPSPQSEHFTGLVRLTMS
ncbi:hypothetical protein A2U01_0007900 [Trifolium medium]|uniref:Uncharacterized protein n=1 Tax=Trifolium medium TaxID=97028 RepID=A0A392MHQ0_9FABA|nr:hypothetical protein [Trifolium medium]